MRKSKKFVAVLLVLCALCTFPLAAFAAESPELSDSAELEGEVTVTMTDSYGRVSTHVIDLSTCVMVAVDEFGNVIPQPRIVTPLSQHNIGQGVTMYYCCRSIFPYFCQYHRFI